MKISHPYPDSLPAEMGPLSPRDPSAPVLHTEYSPEREEWHGWFKMGPIRIGFFYSTKEEFIDGLRDAVDALDAAFHGQGPRIMNVAPRP